jgi:hypothetical protein
MFIFRDRFSSISQPMRRGKFQSLNNETQVFGSPVRFDAQLLVPSDPLSFNFFPIQR